MPYTVVREIDKYKDGPRGKIKTWAKSVSSKFGDYFLDDNYQKKLGLIQIDDPSDEVLSMNLLEESHIDFRCIDFPWCCKENLNQIKAMVLYVQLSQELKR